MDYATLLRRTSFALTMALIAVLICYFWIDRPVAFFVHRHHIDEINFLRWLTYPAPELQTWSPLLVTLLLVRGAWGPLLHWEKVLLVACLSLIVADQFRICLGDVCGRYWPETWRQDNPSLIDTGTYGFHPFQRGDEIVSFAIVWLIAIPGSWVILAVLGLPMLISLVAMNYHFVGDVIAGSVLGGIVATYATHLARLRPDGQASA